MAATIDRRRFLGGVAGGAALLALSWRASAGPLHGPAPGVIKLSSNENPYGPSPKALAAAAQAMEKGAYYPGDLNRALIEALAARFELSEDHVMTSSGSMEALFAAADSFMPYGRVVAPSLTFGPHLRRIERFGGEVVRVPLTEAMDQDLDALAQRVDHTVSLVYVCNPNNPTGLALDNEALRRFVAEVSPRATVLIDEAYNELTDAPERSSLVDLVRAGENVIVTRTFSKLYGLAGLRVGYTLAPPHLIDSLARRRMSRPNAVGAAAALASLEDDTFVEYSLAKIVEGREMVTDLFTRMDIPYVPSQTNFVYANIGRNADVFQASMAERGIKIRGIYAPYDTWSRVSMGKLEDLAAFVQVFEQVYA